MERFFLALQRSLESHPSILNGKCFLPAYLKNRRLTDGVFPSVARDIARRLNLTLKKEVNNAFAPDLAIGFKRQRLNNVYGRPEKPKYFFEVESLNRAQLCLFLPDGHRNDDSKLWYYWGTVCKALQGHAEMPRYFVWLLILPDEPVSTMPFWDASSYYKLFSPRLRAIVQDSPFRFYDQLIKTSAKLFLHDKDWIRDGRGKDDWLKGRLLDYQDRCELVIITCTGKQLLMSRGSDEFDPAKEKRVLLRRKQC